MGGYPFIVDGLGLFQPISPDWLETRRYQRLTKSIPIMTAVVKIETSSLTAS